MVCSVLQALNVRGTVVDLGCGPGSLAARIAENVEGAYSVGVDADPFLLELGRAASPEVEFVYALIGQDGWEMSLERYGRPAAVVSSTALHYQPPTDLADLYRTLARLLPTGGVLLNADMFPLATPGLDAVAKALIAQPAPDAPDWESWWNDVHRDERVADLLAARKNVTLPGGGDNGLTSDAHIALMQVAGFREVGEVWRHGRSAVIAAIR